MTATKPAFPERVAEYQRRVDAALAAHLPDAEALPSSLHQAMRYSVLGGGKRIRPLLVYATGEVLDAPIKKLDAPAIAVELIHAFSLVHDDLPAMDDDDLRRGRPTTHRKFDEATAILAGDALQALAFSVLCDNPELRSRPEVQVALIRTLADAAGSLGMTGGQSIDLASEGRTLELAVLEDMHQKKTGLLIRAAVVMTCHIVDAPATTTARLDEYGRLVGLAFQIRDDVLDLEGDTRVIGKKQGADLERNKATYPAILGVDGAKRRAAALLDEALTHLDEIPADCEPLRWLARFIVSRDQ